METKQKKRLAKSCKKPTDPNNKIQVKKSNKEFVLSTLYKKSDKYQYFKTILTHLNIPVLLE